MRQREAAPGDVGLYVSEEEVEEMLQSIQRRPGYPGTPVGKVERRGKFDGDPSDGEPSRAKRWWF